MEADEGFVLSEVEAGYLRLARNHFDQRVQAAQRELDLACAAILAGRDLRGVYGRFDVEGEVIRFIPGAPK